MEKSRQMQDNTALKQIASNTSDRVSLAQEELTLSNTAQGFPFTGISKGDVYSAEIRVREVGSPTDSTYIANLTLDAADTPTTTHGQYLGNGDFYEITNQANIFNFKIIATESLAHICHIIYYGK